MRITSKLKYDDAGLIPAVVQNHETKEVLMVAYMNQASVEKTLETGKATFWSRSRQKFWIKGESSGHFLFVKEVRIDCDADCLLVTVDPVGPACHEGFRTCFFRKVNESGEEFVQIMEREKDPVTIYGSK
ncbi:MAG: phosphoribosyl-AMP cyclohydrolase [Chthonomonadales bacterium]